MPPKFKLDFNLSTPQERTALVKSFNLETLTPKELELCANYILYAKDPETNTSPVSRKEVFIKTKFDSYSQTEPVSLDALIETPTFNENIINAHNTKYKTPRPTIDKDAAEKVPGMREIWDQIDALQDIYDQNTGKKPLKSRPLSSKELYYLNHQIIDLRRQQYYLMDSVKQTIQTQPNKSNFFTAIQDTQLNYPIFPRGVMREENDVVFKNPRLFNKVSTYEVPARDSIQSGKPYIDFTNPLHIYNLILFYWDIKDSIKDLPDSPLHNLLWTLDFYIEKANLNKQQQLIVEDKKIKTPNKVIAAHLKETLECGHQENYISTIWNKVVELIAAAAQLNYDEWVNKDKPEKWKTCNCCGQSLLKDARNFVRKAKSSDGLTSCCKKCDKLKRLRRKDNNG